jgi:hypothetical protein
VGSPFNLVLACGFYDGVEDGVAFRNDGSAVAFWTIADSPLRLFGAFYFRTLLDLDCARELAADARSAGTAFAFAGSSVDECVGQVGPIEQVGVGHPYLEWMNLAPATAPDLEVIVGGETEEIRYRRAHSFVKKFQSTAR